jgi:hypothetical protein
MRPQITKLYENWIRRMGPLYTSISHQKEVAFRAGFREGRKFGETECLSVLEEFLENYISLVESGDCGIWNPYEEPHVIKAANLLKRKK